MKLATIVLSLILGVSTTSAFAHSHHGFKRVKRQADEVNQITLMRRGDQNKKDAKLESKGEDKKKDSGRSILDQISNPTITKRLKKTKEAFNSFISDILSKNKLEFGKTWRKEAAKEKTKKKNTTKEPVDK